MFRCYRPSFRNSERRDGGRLTGPEMTGLDDQMLTIKKKKIQLSNCKNVEVFSFTLRQWTCCHDGPTASMLALFSHSHFYFSGTDTAGEAKNEKVQILCYCPELDCAGLYLSISFFFFFLQFLLFPPTFVHKCLHFLDPHWSNMLCSLVFRSFYEIQMMLKVICCCCCLKSGYRNSAVV